MPTLENYLNVHYIRRSNWLRAAVLGANELGFCRRLWSLAVGLWSRALVTVFGLWQLVFGLIISTGMNILPKTKDQQLKTLIVFGLWRLGFGLRSLLVMISHQFVNTLTYLFSKGLYACGVQWGVCSLSVE